MGVTHAGSSGPQAQEYLERDGIVAEARIERGRLGVNGHIGSEPELAGAILNEIPNAPKGVRPAPVGGVTRCLRKEFVFVDQFQARENVVSLPEIQSRFQQIAVQVRVRRDFLYAPSRSATWASEPPPSAGRILRTQSGATGCRVRGFGMFQPPNAVLRRPVTRGRHKGSRRPGINAPSWILQRRSLGSRPLKAEASNLTRSITNPVVMTPKLV